MNIIVESQLPWSKENSIEAYTAFEEFIVSGKLPHISPDGSGRLLGALIYHEIDSDTHVKKFKDFDAGDHIHRTIPGSDEQRRVLLSCYNFDDALISVIAKNLDSKQFRIEDIQRAIDVYHEETIQGKVLKIIMERCC